MSQTSLSMKPTLRESVLSKVKRFNIRHKRLSYLGVLFALVFVIIYNFISYFTHNVKRFSCILSIILFYVVSSSFSYPAPLSLNVSFVSSNEKNYDLEEYDIDVIQSAEIIQSDVELSEVEIDEAAIENEDIEIKENVIEGELTDGDLASVSEILGSDDVNDVELSTASDEVTFDANDWKIMLVNKQHPIPEGYDFPLGDITDTMHCDERIISYLKAMLQAAERDGVNLVICSPYRNSSRQENLFNTKIDNYMAAGMSYMEAYNLASQAVTVPGSSEHQIGLALDIVSDTYSLLEAEFGDTDAGKWLAANSYKYGFVLRYPLGKEDITGIEFEPWHFRFVGVDAASVMYNEDLCLEEFWTEYLHN
ncbi:MAG: M15 family metallopeptidase [Butyrivibrio sp.]|nr:M15 family metallopeptidase [Butyrivibrio sp.]